MPIMLVRKLARLRRSIVELPLALLIAGPDAGIGMSGVNMVCLALDLLGYITLVVVAYLGYRAYMSRSSSHRPLHHQWVHRIRESRWHLVAYFLLAVSAVVHAMLFAMHLLLAPEVLP